MRRRARQRMWLFLIATTVVVFATSLFAMQYRYIQRDHRLQEVRAYRDQLILQVQDLTAQLEYAKTDDYIIRAARDQLGYIMPDEYRYVNNAK